MKLKIRLFLYHTLGAYYLDIAFILYLFQHPVFIDSSGRSDFVRIPPIFPRFSPILYVF